MHTIVFLDRGTVRASLRPPVFPHRWIDFDHSSRDEVIDRLANATIAITNKVPIGEVELERLPRLRLIAVTATGYDNIDLDSCRRRTVGVTNVPHYATASVPEHVFMLILNLRRNFVPIHKAVLDGRWATSTLPALLDFPLDDLAGSAMGLVGYGDLAQGVERLARAFGMIVRIAERPGAAALRPGRVSFEETLRESDVVSLHVPLTPETKHFFGRPQLAMMKRKAILINTARGALIDEVALADALRAGMIAGAGVDVLSEEPPRRPNPLLAPDVPNLLVTPHVAWSSRQALAILTEEVIQNLEAFVDGKRRNRLV